MTQAQLLIDPQTAPLKRRLLALQAELLGATMAADVRRIIGQLVVPPGSEHAQLAATISGKGRKKLQKLEAAELQRTMDQRFAQVVEKLMSAEAKSVYDTIEDPELRRHFVHAQYHRLSTEQQDIVKASLIRRFGEQKAGAYLEQAGGAASLQKSVAVLKDNGINPMTAGKTAPLIIGSGDMTMLAAQPTAAPGKEPTPGHTEYRDKV